MKAGQQADSIRLLIVSAWWPEQRALYSACAQLDDVRDHVGSVDVSDAERVWISQRVSQLVARKVTSLPRPPEKTLQIEKLPEKNVAFLCCGVGAVNAAMNTTLALQELPSLEQIYFCATAGAFDKSVPLASLAVSTECLWTDKALVEGESYLPGIDKNYVSLRCEAQLPKAISSLHLNKTLSTLGVTRAAALAQAYSKFADVENLELYGVALAAQKKKINWAAFLGISNTVGPEAHGQWKALHIDASLVAQTAVYAAMFGGVGGSSPG